MASCLETEASMITLQKDFGLEMPQPKAVGAWNILSSHFIHDFNAGQEPSFPYKLLLYAGRALFLVFC